jgi:ectoine hydroxylase-related dioxygenase (phytanoyl-CoA dioxygenase family)
MQLTPDQLSAFEHAGFVLVSGLIDPELAQRAYDRVITKSLGTEATSQHQFVRDRLVRACFTRELCSAAQQLVGPRVRVRAPFRTYAITVFPGTTMWDWPKPHIDHALEKDSHKTFPPAFHMGCLIYLNEVAPQSGATVVWPGSHMQIEDFAAAHLARYEYLAKLNADLNQLVFRSPVEIISAAGDVLFYHHLLAHAGSANTGSKPRVALNHKW